MKQYDHRAASFKPMIIKTADNNRPYDKIGPYSTQGEPPNSIDAGEVVTLFENLDISEEYVILKPGKYTIQFHGRPASNIIEFEIKPGNPTEIDLLVASLVDILPDPNWRVVAPKMPPNAHGQNLVVLGRGFKQKNSAWVRLWLTKRPGDIIEHRQHDAISDYLGKNDSGYFYIEIPPEAMDYWPTIKEDIVKALKLNKSDL